MFNAEIMIVTAQKHLGYEELPSRMSSGGEHTDLAEESVQIKHSGASAIKLQTETITADQSH